MRPGDDIQYELSPVIRRVVGETEPVTGVYKLLTETASAEAGLFEFNSALLKSHVIVANNHGNVSNMHALLSEKTSATFSEMHTGDDVLFLVPDGTRSLARIVPSLLRDVKSYSGLFSLLGVTLNQLDDANLGFPHPTGILSRFAFSVDDEFSRHGRVFLIPPYELHSDVTMDDVYDGLTTSLLDAGFEGAQAGYLMKKVDDGRTSLGN